MPARARGVRLLEDAIATTLVGRGQAYLDQPWVKARTIRVDSTKVGVLDFYITAAPTRAFYQKGYQSAQTFLSTWDWPAHLNCFRHETPAPR